MSEGMIALVALSSFIVAVVSRFVARGGYGIGVTIVSGVLAASGGVVCFLSVLRLVFGES